MHGSWLRIACSQRRVSSSSLRSSVTFDDSAEILLDRPLILRGRRDDPGVEDGPVLIDLVAVVEHPPRSLTRPMPDGPAGRHLYRGRVRLLVGLDQRERLVRGLNQLDGADDDALERVGADRSEARLREPPRAPAGAVNPKPGCSGRADR